MPEYNKTVVLNAFKSLDDNILFKDHPEIDIIVDRAKGKVVTYPKESVGYDAYDSQDRLMKYFIQKGIIDRGSVRSGNVSNSLLAQLLSPKDEDIDKISVCLFGIYNFLKLEEPFFQFVEDFEEDFEEGIIDPDAEHSTELGEIPHKERKGSTPPSEYYGYGYGYRPYVYESKKVDE